MELHDQENDYSLYSLENKYRPNTTAGLVRLCLRNIILGGLSKIPRNLPKRSLTFIYCHYVFNDEKEKFKKILLDLKKEGDFLNTERALQIVKGERTLDKRYYHLSFDDGFRNIYHNAFPVLTKLQIPALFFVPTAYVGGNYECAKHYSLNITKNNHVLELVKWEDLLEMSVNGIEIGSHTSTHSRLSQVQTGSTRFYEEIYGSKMEIERRLGCSCDYISWPFGKITDINDVSIAEIKLAGYKACFGGFRGLVNPAETDPYCIPRQHFEVNWPLSHIYYFIR